MCVCERERERERERESEREREKERECTTGGGKRREMGMCVGVYMCVGSYGYVSNLSSLLLLCRRVVSRSRARRMKPCGKGRLGGKRRGTSQRLVGLIGNLPL